ncbi:MAG: DUF2589 domain-containing protein [Alphaproteobacteria bacterium]|nr:DUF2589 domain-containing protein [Alphaproteobacteria bacterium]
MAEYENRERAFNRSVGGVMGNFARAVVQADTVAKDEHMKRIQAVFGLPDVKLEAKTSLVGFDDAITTSIELPPVALVDMKPLEIDSAIISMDMTVSASTATNSSIKSETAVSGEAKAGWGVFSASIGFSAKVSVAKEHQRKSDYSAKTHAELTMKQGAMPEGLAKVVDALANQVDKTMDINARLIEKQSDILLAQADSKRIPPSGSSNKPQGSAPTK